VEYVSTGNADAAKASPVERMSESVRMSIWLLRRTQMFPGYHAMPPCRECTALCHRAAGHFEGWFNLALARQKSERWEQAAEAYEEALKEARACWSKALEVEPALAQGYFGPSID